MVGLGADLSGDPEWLAANFQHESMDTEVQRQVPYATVLDSESALDAAQQAFAQPEAAATGLEVISAVRLGAFPLARLSRRLLSRALWVWLAFAL